MSKIGVIKVNCIKYQINGLYGDIVFFIAKTSLFQSLRFEKRKLLISQVLCGFTTCFNYAKPQLVGNLWVTE